VTASYTCPRCGSTSHHLRDAAEGYCGNCHDWTREPPGHYFTDGCCDRPRAEHQDTPEEITEWNQWADTEPGLEHRLAIRQAQLQRLIELHAPEVILDNQRRMVREIEEELGPGGEAGQQP
jgi:hypothetical protein